jgi:uncharacterized phiE125 gp8 family phage protein
VEETAAARPVWTRLSLAPVRSISAVSVVATDGEAALLQSGDYAIDIDAASEGWVRILRTGGGRVRVRYRAGLASGWNQVPEPLRQGVVRMAAHLYAQRSGPGDGPPPASVTALWLPYRRLRLA